MYVYVKVNSRGLISSLSTVRMEKYQRIKLKKEYQNNLRGCMRKRIDEVIEEAE